MNQIDLNALSKPIESLRSDLEAAFAGIEARWDGIIEKLSNLPIPGHVGVSVSKGVWLKWGRWKGKKRFVLTRDDGSKDRPYDEWSMNDKIDMLNHVPSIFHEALAATEAFIIKSNHTLRETDAPV